MDIQGPFRLNESFVVRENDRALFSVEKMRIFRFNRTGYALLELLLGGALSYKDWYAKASGMMPIPENDFQAFVEKALTNNVILV